MLPSEMMEWPVGWEDQGRQEHGWFGHGTAPVKPTDQAGHDGTEPFGPDEASQRFAAVAHGAIAALPADLRARAAVRNDPATIERATDLMRSWVRGAALGQAQFAERFLGRAADDLVAKELRAAAMGAAVAKSHAALAEAANHLANAMQGIGIDRWQRFLADAQERASDPATVAAVEKSRQRRNDETTQTSSDTGGKGGGNGPGPVASAFRSVFGHVDPDQWATQGAAAGGVAGALLGGAAGGAGEGAVGAAGGSLALPGGGTIVGGIAGAVDGAAKGALAGGAAGAIVGGAIGRAAGELITYMEGDNKSGDSRDTRGTQQDKGASGPNGPDRPDVEWLKGQTYDDAPYHGQSGQVGPRGMKSPAPKDGAAALRNSYRVSENAPRRIGVDPINKQFVVLDRTAEGLWHGHVRTWEELSQTMRNTLVRDRKSVV